MGCVLIERKLRLLLKRGAQAWSFRHGEQA